MPLSQQSCLVFESQEHCYTASIACGPKGAKEVNEGTFLFKLCINFNSHLNLSSPLFQTIQHEDGPTKINYKGGLKDVHHNRAHHRSRNNRLNTAPIEFADSSQSSSSDKEDDSSNNGTVHKTTVSPVPTSSAQPTMLERAHKQRLKKLSNKEQPPTPATKRHCSAL